MSETSLPQPTSLQADGGSLLIEWGDGVRHLIPWGILRDNCPCASCRMDAIKPQPENPLQLAVLKPEEAQPLKPLSMQPMGNYAYHIAFNDGHNTGIYTVESLRQIGEAVQREMEAG